MSPCASASDPRRGMPLTGRRQICYCDLRLITEGGNNEDSILVIATALALALASTPGLADWAKLKEAASELGTAVSDTSMEAWKDHRFFQGNLGVGVQLGAEAYNKAGA